MKRRDFDLTRRTGGLTYSLPAILWTIFFCYATFAALVVQKLLLPMVPSLHAGMGLLNADSVEFHSVAVSLAESIKTHGWGVLSVWPTRSSTGNVAVLAVLYTFFGPDPVVIIPVNAAIHATCGVMIFAIARSLFEGRVGVYSGVISAVLFVGFPSSLNWYAQLHKDGYTILGSLIILYSWIRGLERPFSPRSALLFFLGTIAGLCLVLFVRPYNARLLLATSVIITVFTFGYLAFKGELRSKWHVLGYFVGAVVIFAVMIPSPRHGTLEDEDVVDLTAVNWEWKTSGWVPNQIEKPIRQAAALRVHTIVSGREKGAKSLIDEERMPDNVASVIAYIPRAFEIGLLAPFPSDWFKSRSVLRLIGALETMVWYLLMPGVFMVLLWRRSLTIYVVLLFATVFLIIYSFTLPNVGTMYRIRYLYLFLFILMGASGWSLLFRRMGKLPFPTPVEEPLGNEEEKRAPGSRIFFSKARVDVTSAGAAVVVFTLAGNLLFFVRDILLARWFGLGNELDTFFMAILIPTFLVTILCMPLGTAVMPSFLAVQGGGAHEKARRFLAKVSTGMFLCLCLLSVAVYFGAGFLMPLLAPAFTPDKIEHSKHLLYLLIPVFFFGGFVILANTVLNALGRYSLPSLAQISVPVVTIIALVLLFHYVGIYALALGMALGQVGNLGIVAGLAKREGFSVLPSFRKLMPGLDDEEKRRLRDVFRQYVPLVLSALFVSLALPINSVMAATLQKGSVAAFNLGSKFVLFFTGIISTAISTVMLPYFANYFAKNRLIDVRRELSFFLYVNTVITTAVAVFLFLIVDHLVRMAFYGGVFRSDDVRTVSRVVEYGVIQLPFFASYMLFSRFASANRKNALVMVASVVGLIANVALDFLLVGRMGVGGIALAWTLSIMISTVLLIVAGHKDNDILWLDVVMSTLSWLLFLTLVLCYHFESGAGVVIAALGLISILAGHLRFFLRPGSRNVVRYVRE
jgi:murein biosynthesis integral membrane protein MurJ